MNAERILGDYNSFFSDLLNRTRAAGIPLKAMPIVQLLYRTQTIPEYESIRDQLKALSGEFVETQFNGRAVSVFILKKSLSMAEGFSASVIELPAPRSAHTYPSGLESVGFLLGNGLSEFKKEYKDVLTGEKDHGPICKPAFITFGNGKTAKFYDHTLQEIVLFEGWEFTKL